MDVFVSYKKDKNGNLVELHLSEQEIDDTSKPSGTNRSLEYSLNLLSLIKDNKGVAIIQAKE